MAVLNEYDCDIAVIGSGAGGGTLAACCAAMGKSVVLFERGGIMSELLTPDGRQDEYRTVIAKQPYDDRTFRIGDHLARLYSGGVAGGGTAVFGGAMVRPEPGDFMPGRYYGDRLPLSVHEWPVPWESFQPWLERAERLYHVADLPAETKSPDSVLTESTESCAGSRQSLPLAEINQRLWKAAWQCGMNPRRLPLAIDSSRCLRCDQCAGFLCPTGARRTSFQLVQEAIAAGAQIQVRTKCEVQRIERSVAGRVGGLWIIDRLSEKRSFVRARRYVLAAGAIASSALLLKSGFEHPMIGRNLMMHYSPIATGLFPYRTDADRTFVKQLMFSDCYYGTSDLPEKMGIIQSLPAPGPQLLAKNGFAWMPQVVRKALRARMLPLVGIVEDLPDPANRVHVENDGTIRIEHQFSSYDRERGAALTRRMVHLLRTAGAWYCDAGRVPSAEHVAHQCGTLRFGNSPQHAVLDPECRVFGFPDLSVADGSFMPVSLGVGPSLTIAANALRIAERLCEEV